MKATHLSRAEVLTLVFDKLRLIEEETDASLKNEESTRGRQSVADMRSRLKRIAVEARRAAALIETFRALKGDHEQ